MSITLSQQEKTYKKPIHQRNYSGDLDVFEAARYFSGASEVSGSNTGATFAHKIMREEERKHGWRSGRISLDMPMGRNPIPSQTHAMEKEMKEKKKPKQPNSPGGRLASFLNSLFSQTPSKKKKSKSMKDEDESPSGRRKRRSSISYFRTQSKPIYSSSSSGFRTPPPGLTLSKQKIGSKEREFGKLSEVDGGADSDSSSDLFELQHHDLGYYPSDLPVYETTHMDSIKRGAPISSAPI